MNAKANKAKKHTAQHLGECGETAVAKWYRQHGYKIVARNWKCFEGEIDLIVSRGKSIVFCEVKTRASDRFMDPALAVTPAKQAKVRTAAFRWLEDGASGQLRFDVALVINGNVRMIEGAF